MRKKLFNTVVILSIIALSLIGGLIYAGIAGKKHRKDYPVLYGDAISSAAIHYEIPANTVCAVIHTRSGWDTAYEKDGKVGLYAMTEEKYMELAGKLDESRDTRLRWSPTVSIEFCAWEIADCLNSFTDKSAAYAALFCGKEKVRRNITANDGKFVLSGMDEYTQKFVRDMLAALEKYNELYPESGGMNRTNSSATQITQKAG